MYRWSCITYYSILPCFIVVFLCLFIGLNQVVADDHACATESKKADVNNLVEGLGQDLASILASQASQAEKMSQTLTAVCNTAE
jgi:hypothetical protein